jgi:hypothetical protein
MNKKNQENEEKLKIIKIMDLRMKLNFFFNKRLRIKIKNKNIKGQILNIIKFSIEAQN